MVSIIDPLKVEGAEGGTGMPSWAEAKRRARVTTDPRKASTYRAAKRNVVRDDPYGRDPALMEDFRNFLTVVWEFLGLPPPSDVQLSLAYWLQHGPSHAVILGFRGMAKSWITGAYSLWTVYRDPQLKVLVVSASLDRAVQTIQWCLALIREMPELQFLTPGPNQRSSGKQFDVGPSVPDQSPSFRGAGISGQITGSRAHLIVPDDVEIPSNSMTTVMREKISEAVKEFDAILHPGGQVKFLGTPQVDDSLYVKLLKRGYTCRVWPARFPDKLHVLQYGDRLAPYILNRLQKDPTLVGHSVWPDRFSDDDLAQRELSYGRSGFELQFMLNTSLSDADRYPLKLRDLIVESLDLVQGPDLIAWGNDQKLIYNNLPVMGFEGDKFFGPANKGDTYSKYNTILGALDPSGRGGDETALSIVAELHGRLFLLFCGGWRDGYSPATLKAIAETMVRFNVNKLVIEDNFGDGMFLALIQPYIIKAWKDANAKRTERDHGGTDVEGVHSPKMQKELRILSVLEPATQGHRLAVSTAVIEYDYKSIQAYTEMLGADSIHHYSLIHQLTHLSREKDSLLHDDRVESLALAVVQFSELLGINPWESARQAADDKYEEELQALFDEADDVADQPHGGRIKWRRTKHPIRPD
jgi:hypothetical protein